MPKCEHKNLYLTILDEYACTQCGRLFEKPDISLRHALETLANAGSAQAKEIIKNHSIQKGCIMYFEPGSIDDVMARDARVAYLRYMDLQED